MAARALCAVALFLAACGAAAQPDNAAIAADFQNHRSNVEVTADGTVVRLLTDQTGATGTHERFIVKLLTGAITVEVEHNVSIGARVPVTEGDHVIVHGEYVWNAQVGLTHPARTQSSPSRPQRS